eukprot:scaffold34460_cov222-Skeletonema_dohrnii-CCMP3373.AAC.4
MKQRAACDMNILNQLNLIFNVTSIRSTKRIICITHPRSGTDGICILSYNIYFSEDLPTPHAPRTESCWGESSPLVSHAFESLVEADEVRVSRLTKI